MITWEQLLMLILIGAGHSAALWIVIDAIKAVGVSGRWLLRGCSLLLGVCSGYLAFPFALRIVTGIEITALEERLVGGMLGAPAAIGAEAMFRLVKRSVVEIIKAGVERLKR